jgi:hypothetical protein
VHPGGKNVCGNALDQELLCKVTVDTDEEVVNLSLKSDGVTLEPQEAWSPEVAWVVDENYVKVCTDDGNV